MSLTNQWYNRLMLLPRDSKSYALTRTQKIVLTYVSEGLSEREIAAALYLSERTVKRHLAAIRSRLGAKNTTHAVVIALWLKLIPPNP